MGLKIDLMDVYKEKLNEEFAEDLQTHENNYFLYFQDLPDLLSALGGDFLQLGAGNSVEGFTTQLKTREAMTIQLAGAIKDITKSMEL